MSRGHFIRAQCVCYVWDAVPETTRGVLLDEVAAHLSPELRLKRVLDVQTSQYGWAGDLGAEVPPMRVGKQTMTPHVDSPASRITWAASHAHACRADRGAEVNRANLMQYETAAAVAAAKRNNGTRWVA